MNRHAAISRYSWELLVQESPDESSFVVMDGPLVSIYFAPFVLAVIIMLTFMLQSAKVGLSTALLKACDSADELAFIFGGCVAHVLLRHLVTV